MTLYDPSSTQDGNCAVLVQSRRGDKLWGYFIFEMLAMARLLGLSFQLFGSVLLVQVSLPSLLNQAHHVLSKAEWIKSAIED